MSIPIYLLFTLAVTLGAPPATAVTCQDLFSRLKSRLTGTSHFHYYDVKVTVENRGARNRDLVPARDVEQIARAAALASRWEWSPPGGDLNISIVDVLLDPEGRDTGWAGVYQPGPPHEAFIGIAVPRVRELFPHWPLDLALAFIAAHEGIHRWQYQRDDSIRLTAGLDADEYDADPLERQADVGALHVLKKLRPDQDISLRPGDAEMRTPHVSRYDDGF